MKKEQICIYKDEAFEKEVVNTLPVAQSALQVLVDEFNRVVMKIPTVKNSNNVAPGELSVLVSNPRQLFDERCLSIEVPQGLKRDAYLNMVDLPSLDSLMASHQAFIKIGYTDPGLYELDQGKVQVNSDAVHQLATSRNVYVEKGSPEHHKFKEIQEFIRLLNHFDEITGNGFLDRLMPAGCPIDDILDIKEKPGSYTRKQAIFNPRKFRDLSLMPA